MFTREIKIYPVLVALEFVLKRNDGLQVADLLFLHTLLLKPVEISNKLNTASMTSKATYLMTHSRACPSETGLPPMRLKSSWWER